MAVLGQGEGVIRAGWAPALVYALQFAGIGVWTAYASIYFSERGVSLAMIGVLAAVPALVAIVAGPAWGLVADRLGDMRAPYLVAAVWAGAAGLWIALGPSTAWLVVAVLVLSIGAAGMTPLLDARTMQRLAPRRERFGQVRAFGSLAFMAAAVVSGALVATTGLRTLFLLYALTTAGAGVAAALCLGRPARRERLASFGPMAAIGLLRAPGLGLFFLGSVVVWTASVGAMTLFSLRVVQLGGDPGLVGVGWAINAGFEVPFMLGFTRFARRVRVEQLIVAGTLLFAVRAACWSVAGTPWLLIGFTGLGAAGYALQLVGTTTYIAARAPAGLQATAQALFGATTFSVGSIAGAVLAGQIATAGGIGAVYPAGVVASVLGTLLTWLGIARRRRFEEAAAEAGRVGERSAA